MNDKSKFKISGFLLYIAEEKKNFVRTLNLLPVLRGNQLHGIGHGRK